MIEFKKVECNCSHGYTCRNMQDPNCCAHSCDYNDLVDALNAMKSELDRLKSCLESKTEIANQLKDGMSDMFERNVSLQAERDKLRQVCAEAYQMAGAIDAPIEALDNLSAAANGCPIPHKTFLPIFGDHLAAHDAEVAKAAYLACLAQCEQYFDSYYAGMVTESDAERYSASLSK